MNLATASDEDLDYEAAQDPCDREQYLERRSELYSQRDLAKEQDTAFEKIQEEYYEDLRREYLYEEDAKEPYHSDSWRYNCSIDPPARLKKPHENWDEYYARYARLSDRVTTADIELGKPRVRELEAVLLSDTTLDEKRKAVKRWVGWTWGFAEPNDKVGWPGIHPENLPSTIGLKRGAAWARYQEELRVARERRKAPRARQDRGALKWLETDFLAGLPEALKVGGQPLARLLLGAKTRLQKLTPEVAAKYQDALEQAERALLWR